MRIEDIEFLFSSVIKEGPELKKRRRCIGVLIRGVENKFQKSVLEGIFRQAYALDYNVAVFSMIDENIVLEDFQIGEKNIFSLVNPELIDGFIFPQTAFQSQGLQTELVDILKGFGKPVVCVDFRNETFPYSMIDDKKGFSNLVTHLIEVHNCKKIYCLTGVADFYQTQVRLNGYYDAMDSHGLFYDKSYIFEGDFWKDAAITLAEDIYEGKVERPDAIACHNDWMAIHLCNKLTDLGIRVPQDIAIVGYDGVAESRDNVPTITTYQTPDVDAGADAVCMLYKILTGKDCKRAYQTGGYLIIGESCGCKEDISRNMDLQKKQIRSIQTYEEYYRSSNMLEKLTASKSFDEFCSTLLQLTYIIRNCTKVDLCMCDDWDSLSSDKVYKTKGYTDKITPVLREEQRFPFKIKFMYPDLWAEKEKPGAYYFFPIHFNDRTFGYAVFYYENLYESCDEIYWNWIRALCMALEYMRTSNCMKTLNNMLKQDSMTDTLTGINNTYGYKSNCNELIEKLKDTDLSLLVISVDMDDLKVINDTYGHIEGNNALKTIANALRVACIKNEVCARIGGDEFIILGVGNYTNEIADEIVSNINEYISKYNNASDNPYKVHASLGYAIEKYHDEFDYDDVLNKADKNMYKNKAKYKGLRNIR